MEKNDVTSFFFYMWNAWNEAECATVFMNSSCIWTHFWNKWTHYVNRYGPSNAIPTFYAELSDDNRDLLVKRALEVYDRNHKI